MGGYGSGRHGYRQTVEGCRTLDIYKMKRLGCLETGRRGHWIWSRDDEEVARIGYHCEQDALVLDYKVRVNSKDWEAVKQTVPLVQLDCHYGGQRIYACCPGVVNGTPCGRRVGKLYSGGKFFRCRHCYKLGYSSQSEARHYRLLRRANKLRMALGGEPGAASFIAPKPKGMWERTYEQMCAEIEWCEHQANFAFLTSHGHFLSEDERNMLLGRSNKARSVFVANGHKPMRR
ncbi:hypothetical protein [Thalassobacter stenotrophicus]|uniref:hypothetical protein n=1 Tax=Thalassobacter stenotrophicus TaxID=266809 RepID=UPI00068980A6|nr:hypothetical protein [Thalassobacter stenotrophicus]